MQLARYNYRIRGWQGLRDPKYTRTLQPSAPWLSCAPFLALTHGGKGFNLKVSPGQLPPGAHYAEVAGHDSSSPRRGPLFSLPVTVCRPHANLAAPHAQATSTRGLAVVKIASGNGSASC